MKKFFITGTGTGVGKTLVTTALCHQLKVTGKRVAAFKPIISGFDGDDLKNDTALILQSLGLPVTKENVEAISPWRFSHPLSPDMAAKKESRIIELDELVSFCKTKEKEAIEDKTDIVLMEGVGGVCVPLNNNHTVLDWMAALEGWKIVLVVGSYLGSLSHTISAVKTLASVNITPHTVIVSESEGSSVILEDTMETLSRFLPEETLIKYIPYCHSNDNGAIWEVMPNISEVCV